MGRKVFISFLGFSNYSACQYGKDGFCSVPTRYIQVATLDYLNHIDNWGENDAAYILLTKGAEEKNWIDNGQTDRQGNTIEQNGLQSELSNRNYPFSIQPVRNIPDGNNEEEIWQIFETVFNLIQEDDELYFDLTHGFRYLPMLTLVLGNYAATLKKAHVKSITYGNFEGRNRNTEVAELIDLLPLSALQEWTFAAADYIDNGNTKHLKRLTEENYKPIFRYHRDEKEKVANARLIKTFTDALVDFVDDIQTCRGNNLINGNNVAALQNAIEQAKEINMKPLVPIMGIIEENINMFVPTNDVRNAYNAAKWCLDNEQYQPAATILQEAIITYYCQKHGIDEYGRDTRKVVTTAVSYLISNTTLKVNADNYETIERLMADESLRTCKDLFENLTGIRNDFNHSGMRTSPKPPKAIRKNIVKCMDAFGALFEEECENKSTHSLPPSLLINFSNHASEKWSEEQMAEATRRFGNIVDFPFPEVNPSADEADIEDLAKKCVEQMRAMANGTVFAVHAMGEMTLTMAVVETLKNLGITCVASTTERIVNEISPDKKEVTFNFVRFREY